MSSEIKEAPIVRVQPGDVILLKTDRPLTAEQADNVKAGWASQCRGTAIEGTPMVILDAGCEISILRKVEDE